MGRHATPVGGVKPIGRRSLGAHESCDCTPVRPVASGNTQSASQTQSSRASGDGIVAGAQGGERTRRNSPKKRSVAKEVVEGSPNAMRNNSFVCMALIPFRRAVYLRPRLSGRQGNPGTEPERRLRARPKGGWPVCRPSFTPLRAGLKAINPRGFGGMVPQGYPHKTAKSPSTPLTRALPSAQYGPLRHPPPGPREKH